MSRLPPPAPRALIFDLDGTLVDSRRDIAEACNAALVSHGFAALPFEAIIGIVGDGARVLVMRAFGFAAGDPRLDDAVAAYNRIYLASPHAQTTLLPGARDVLDVCVEAELPCGIVTNKQRDVTLAVLAALEITPFAPRFTLEMTAPSSPTQAACSTLRRVSACPPRARG